MEVTFQRMSLYDSDGEPVELTSKEIRRFMEEAVDKRFPSLGASVEFFTISPLKRDNNTVRIEICTGTHGGEPFIDSCDLSIGGPWKVPDLSYFEQSIKILRPFEAFLAEDENEYQLDAHGILQTTRFKKPEIIRAFHYLDAEMARSIGGIEYCLEAPAWRVERFCDGVLIQLVPVLFDSTNSRHLQVQKDVMRYFKL